jgi:hypothetical protein
VRRFTKAWRSRPARARRSAPRTPVRTGVLHTQGRATDAPTPQAFCAAWSAAKQPVANGCMRWGTGSPKTSSASVAHGVAFRVAEAADRVVAATSPSTGTTSATTAARPDLDTAAATATPTDIAGARTVLAVYGNTYRDTPYNISDIARRSRLSHGRAHRQDSGFVRFGRDHSLPRKSRSNESRSYCSSCSSWARSTLSSSSGDR